MQNRWHHIFKVAMSIDNGLVTETIMESIGAEIAET
jgi:hypothetical protein